MQHHFNTNSYTFTYVIVLVNGFNSENLIDITIFVARTSYSGHKDGIWASYFYFEGTIAVPHYTIAVSCIYTLLGAILLGKKNSWEIFKFDIIKDHSIF